jgi:hypothetical protein
VFQIEVVGMGPAQSLGRGWLSLARRMASAYFLKTRGNVMGDLVFVAVTTVFFIGAIGYVYFCDRVK